MAHGDGEVSVEAWGCFLGGGVGDAADFERADTVEEGRTSRAAAFPCNASGTRLIADRFGAFRRDNILVTACDHIERDVEVANPMRRMPQGVDRRSMAGETRQRARREQLAVVMLYCLGPDHDIANG